MTSEEVDRRIVLSRLTLSLYVAVTAKGVDALPDALTLVRDEIAVLQGIAEEHPEEMARLTALAGDWTAFLEGMRARLH